MENGSLNLSISSISCLSQQCSLEINSERSLQMQRMRQAFQDVALAEVADVESQSSSSGGFGSSPLSQSLLNKGFKKSKPLGDSGVSSSQFDARLQALENEVPLSKDQAVSLQQQALANSISHVSNTQQIQTKDVLQGSIEICRNQLFEFRLWEVVLKERRSHFDCQHTHNIQGKK